MPAESKLNPGFADRLITLLTQADMQPKELQGEAEVGKQGLWKDKNPVAPWEWRREQRRGK